MNLLFEIKLRYPVTNGTENTVAIIGEGYVTLAIHCTTQVGELREQEWVLLDTYATLYLHTTEGVGIPDTPVGLM